MMHWFGFKDTGWQGLWVTYGSTLCLGPPVPRAPDSKDVLVASWIGVLSRAAWERYWFVHSLCQGDIGVQHAT